MSSSPKKLDTKIDSAVHNNKQDTHERRCPQFLPPSLPSMIFLQLVSAGVSSAKLVRERYSYEEVVTVTMMQLAPV